MAVPWAQIVRWAPQILAVSRDLLQRSRSEEGPPPAATPADATGLAPRIAALEENERRQAELVDRMAAQQAELARAAMALHTQLRWLWGVATLLAVSSGVSWYLLAQNAS